MSSTAGIAQSGLAVAGMAVDVSANNIANALTEDFVPSRVVPATADPPPAGLSAAARGQLRKTGKVENRA